MCRLICRSSGSCQEDLKLFEGKDELSDLNVFGETRYSLDSSKEVSAECCHCCLRAKASAARQPIKCGCMYTPNISSLVAISTMFGGSL